MQFSVLVELVWVGLWCLTPLLTIFLFFRGGVFFNGRGTLVPGENHEMVWGFACILTIHNLFIID
jgi:hypothetical protein